MKRMENIFDLSKNGAKKVYIDGELFPIRVGMREISLQNGEKVLIYDTSGPYTEENHTIDIQRGISGKYVKTGRASDSTSRISTRSYGTRGKESSPLKWNT